MPRLFPPPYFFHLVFDANLASIMERGLLSSESLLTQAGYSIQERHIILRRQRRGPLVLPNGVTLRDQSPMPPDALRKALPPHVSPEEWYQLLNGFVFLWADIERVERHWRAGGEAGQSLFVFDAPRILEDLGDRIRVSAINSGNARRQPSPRAPETLVPFLTWKESGWPIFLGKQRPRGEVPVEILVRDYMPLEPFLLGIIPPEDLQAKSFNTDLIEVHVKRSSRRIRRPSHQQTSL